MSMLFCVEQYMLYAYPELMNMFVTPLVKCGNAKLCECTE